MKCFAVVDTNVIVSALITKKHDSPPKVIFRAMLSGEIIPLYNKDIILEYVDVLRREKFHLREDTIQTVIKGICQFGLEVEPTPTGEILTDMDDLVFYEVVMEKRKEYAFLVTGNKKHYPDREYIVTPAEMVKILSGK